MRICYAVRMSTAPTYTVSPDRIAAINSANDWAEIANHQNNLTPDEALLLLNDVLPGLYAIQASPSSLYVRKTALGMPTPPPVPDYSDSTFYVKWREIQQNSSLYHAVPLNLLSVAFSLDGNGQTGPVNVAVFVKTLASIKTDQEAIAAFAGLGVSPSAVMAYVQRIRGAAPSYFTGSAFDWVTAGAVLVAYLQGFYAWTWQGSAPKINTQGDAGSIAVREPAVEAPKAKAKK